jgi:hypothetical protein
MSKGREASPKQFLTFVDNMEKGKKTPKRIRHFYEIHISSNKVE